MPNQDKSTTTEQPTIADQASVDKAAHAILVRHLDAFKELAK